MKIKFHNHILQENSTTIFNTQDNNKTTVAANLTAGNSTTNSNINTRTMNNNKHQLTKPHTTINRKPAALLNVTTSAAFGLIDKHTQAALTTSRTK